MEPDEFCRQIEAYLCRKNDGHLIRIVGPAFEQVTGWSRRGVPFKVACQGIDRYFERYYREGPRRRPVRIEFCEADVLDAFDAWRRSVGIAVADRGAAGDATELTARPRALSLPAHLNRAITRLSSFRAQHDWPGLGETCDRILSELDRLAAGARGARGEARHRALDRLRELDRELIETVTGSAPGLLVSEMGRLAESDLEPFRGRMDPDALERARVAAIEGLIRHRLGLPVLALE